jgi:small-conductance mechanosensitive channel
LAIGVLLTIPADGLGQWTVFIGLLGAGLAFALQEVIASLAGWLVLSTGGFYRVGHRVQLGGIRGDVIDIGFLRTTLMELGQWVEGDLYNGRIVRVANSFVFKEPVFNYTSDFPFLWDEIKIPITYESDRRLARAMLEEAATAITGAYAERVHEGWQAMVRKYPIEEARLQPLVSLEATDNWLSFTVRFVVDTKRRRPVRDALFERILADIDASEGRVAIASTTVRVLSDPSGT